MRGDTTVDFRGERRTVVIDRDTGYDPETNSQEIDWHFEGVTPEEHDALGLTADEEQSIFEQLSLRDEPDAD